MKDELLTIEEAANILRVSKVQIYRLWKRGELPVVRMGRRYTRIRRQDINAFIERHTDKGGQS
jgi:excisionase family DNA binding protein